MDGEIIEEIVVKMLKERKMTISFAESCTGGMLSARITNVPGASEIFERGFVTYSNKAKVELLGVKEDTLEKFGDISKETAVEMAEGARTRARVDIGVGITGIAGPDGGSENKPVGLVYIAVVDVEGTEVREFRFAGERERVRLQAVLSALDLLRRRIVSSNKY